MNVLVLHDPAPDGARPDLTDVEDQVALVVSALDALGHTSRVLAFTLDPGPLQAAAPDVVVNLVEGVEGVNRQLHLAAAMLEALGIPFTGSGCAALALSTHKRLAKGVLGAAGVRVPKDWPDGGPRYIVKPVEEDASVGIDDASVVDGEQVEGELRRRSARYGPCLAETFVDGREVNVSILEDRDGPRVLPVAEIVFDPEVFAHRPRLVGYEAKWVPGSIPWRSTHRRFPEEGLDRAAIASVASRAWSALGLRGYGRVDLRVDETGAPWVIEVNANPCISPDAGFMAAAAEAGLTPVDVVEILLRQAVRR